MRIRSHSIGNNEKIRTVFLGLLALLSSLSLFAATSHGQGPNGERQRVRDPSLHESADVERPARDTEREREQEQELERIRDGVCAGDPLSCERFRFLEEERVRRMEHLALQNRLSPSLRRMEMRRLRRILRQEGLAIPLSARVNDTFDISLPTNPSTGYAWEVSFDEEYLSLEESSYVPSSSGLLGASGEQLFRFKALAEGTTFVVFRSLRSWEEGVAPADLRIYVVTIR